MRSGNTPYTCSHHAMTRMALLIRPSSSRCRFWCGGRGGYGSGGGGGDGVRGGGPGGGGGGGGESAMVVAVLVVVLLLLLLLWWYGRGGDQQGDMGPWRWCPEEEDSCKGQYLYVCGRVGRARRKSESNFLPCLGPCVDQTTLVAFPLAPQTFHCA